MECDESSHTLEALIVEFFEATTTNERKREIEESLNNFSNQPRSWKYCLSYLTSTSNKYLMMYCLNVLENFITRQWLRMPGPDKCEIRTTLFTNMLNRYKDVPNFIINKLGKLIVDIGRHDWPHCYPDFFISIHQLAHGLDTAPIGLMLIQTAFEELTSPREDICAFRKDELRKLLLEQVPIVLNILCGHLENVLEKHSHLVTATPPPSPTHTNEDMCNVLFSTSPLHTGSILSGIFKTTKKSPFHQMPLLDEESHQLCVLSLKCLAQLLGWMPLSSYVTSSLLTTVFHFASFGCNPEPLQKNVASNSSTIEGNIDLGIQAMACINEIMSRNCIPTEFEEFLLQLFQDTFKLLQHLTKDGSNSRTFSTKHTLSNVNESFTEKFTDFLNLFVGLHLKRFESNPNFPVLEFLALLFKYTFQQPSHEGFYSCLDIWNIFLDYLSTKLRSRDVEYHSILDRYKDALNALAQEICKKLQFRYNQASLEELDDEELDDDSKTEWQNFLRQCLEITSKICDLIPVDIFKLIFSVFEENLQVYLGLERVIKISEYSETVSLLITGENECRRLHCSLRDLSSMLQGVGRLIEHMSGEHYLERKVIALKALERLCYAAAYSNRLRFYSMKTAAPLVLKTDFIEVHAQILATIKAFSHWLLQYSRELPSSESQMSCSIERAIADVAVPNIKQEVPVKVVHSAGHLLMSLTATVRPAFLFSSADINKLFACVCEGKLHYLPIETQLLVYRSISNMLLLPWAGKIDHQQEWSTRSSQHDSFIQALSFPLKSAFNNPAFFHSKLDQDNAKPGILWVLNVFSNLIDNISDAPTKTKHLFYESVRNSVSMIESLLHIYLDHSDVSESILDFFLSLFDVLKAQIGTPFVERTMQNFINLFTANRLVEFIIHEGASGSKVIEKLLQLLQRIIQEPASSSKKYLPNTINLCMDKIYPIIAERTSPEVKAVLFELLHSLLLHNWKYFFKGHVTATAFSSSVEEVVENELIFIKIMEAFGHSFLQPDIGLFRQNLAALESLNNKWKLYHKAFFKTVMLNQFLNVLLQSLVHKSHDLLQDEISLTIYNMASVDFTNFFQVFLPQFLQSLENLESGHKSTLLQNFKQETDLPSFCQNMLRFVNDLRYCAICNSPLL